MTPQELTVACKEGVEMKAWAPVADDPATPEIETRTHCNFFVNFVAEKFGYFHFRGKMANEIIDLMATSPEWAKADFVTAQASANKGHLAVVGMKAEGHGHVCVVRPGETKFSGKWACQVPIVANVGTVNSWDKHANEIFPGKQKPGAWVLI